MTSVITRHSGLLLKLLLLLITYAAFTNTVSAATLTPISATTLLPSTVAVGKTTSSSSSSANSIKLTVSPSTTVFSGSQLNFTCTFKTLPRTDNIYFVMNSNYLSRTIAQVSTRLMAAVLPMDIRQRIAIYLLNDGVSLQFDFTYTVSTDTGTYRCYIAGDVGSNSVSVTINNNYGEQPIFMTTSQLTASDNFMTTPTPTIMPYPYTDYGVQSTSSVNIPLVLTITIGSACVITACILFALRMKYRDRFCRTCKTRTQQPPTYVTTTHSSGSQHGGTTNAAYTVDPDQLPSYVDAIKIADPDQFMPPSYNDVMTSPAPCVPSAPMPEQNPASNV